MDGDRGNRGAAVRLWSRVVFERGGLGGGFADAGHAGGGIIGRVVQATDVGVGEVAGEGVGACCYLWEEGG